MKLPDTQPSIVCLTQIIESIDRWQWLTWSISFHMLRAHLRSFSDPLEDGNECPISQCHFSECTIFSTPSRFEPGLSNINLKNELFITWQNMACSDISHHLCCYGVTTFSQVLAMINPFDKIGRACWSKTGCAERQFRKAANDIISSLWNMTNQSLWAYERESVGRMMIISFVCQPETSLLLRLEASVQLVLPSFLFTDRIPIIIAQLPAVLPIEVLQCAEVGYLMDSRMFIQSRG
jgi:hypothetical protein